MLEHSAMLYGAVSPPMLADEDVTFPDFYTRLGPCELQDPLWVKMSAVAAGATKKRKKSDTKPQAQINKCNNEKRRREQENIYIEELAELISHHFGDMSSLSVKPDKCAILHETVNQIRNIKAREEAAASSGTGGGTQTDAVQQGEVSSSRPTILANEVIAPLLLEALDGFLFVVNAEGKVEFVTENVSTYIKFSREEVLGKSVYNIIHHGDHARFSTTLLPSISWGAASGAGGSGSTSSNDGTGNALTNNNGIGGGGRSRSFYCRLLIKPPDDQDETMEEKQTRINHYEQMHISSTQVPYSQTSAGGMSVGDVEDSSGEPGPCLMCLARRVPQCEKTPSASIEQFTTKLDITGKIVGIDTSGVSASYSQYLNKDLMGRIIHELCPQQEIHKLSAHLKETITTNQATSEIYRIRITSSEKYIRIQTKSKLFKNNPPEPDFIMATHSIIGDHEPAAIDLDGGNVGGPLMPSVMNGTRNGVPTNRFSGAASAASDGGSSAASSNNSLTPTSNASYNPFSLSNTDLEFDFFPSTTWPDLGTPGWSDATPRPDSCQSVTPVSTPTPRPPSVPVYSPAPPAMSSPFATQPSPSASNPPTSANNPFSNSFPFSPLPEPGFTVDEPKDSKENVLEEASAMADSGRLRNLLTKPPASSSDSSNDAEVRNKHRILKDLLNQEDDEEKRSENGASPRGLVGGRNNNVPGPGPGSGPSPSPGQGTSSGSVDQPKHANNMLLKLLNEKNDDDDVEQRAGLKKRSELLQQLLKEQDEERKPTEQQATSQKEGDALLRSLGFNSSPSPPSNEQGPGKARKRPSDERDDLMAKRPNDSVQVSSSGPSVGNSKLYEKNKMLASLLAKQPSCTPIPPIPASVISATPQDKLPRVTKNDFGLMGQQTPATSQSNTVENNRQSVGRVRGAMTARQPQTSYLNQMLTPSSDNHNIQTAQHIRQTHMNRGQYTQMDTSTYATTAPTSTENSWENLQSSSDPLLSDILDQVIDIVPDAVISDSNAIMNLLDAIESPQNNNNNFQQAMNEKMAINAIQKSLMQCETAVKSPSSPISLPGTPPAYSTAMTSSQTSQQQQSSSGFPPPPVYQRPTHSGSFPIQQQRTGQTVRPGGGPQYAMAPGQQQHLLLQQRKLLQQQQEQKRRLLHQQQQQQLLIPSNAAAAELNPGLQNIDSLINNTVAPNVTLQRSSSLPDSQLSPGYGNSIVNVNSGNQSQRQSQQPYSPHSQMASPLNQQQQGGYPQTTVNNFQQGGSRLSPHPPFQQQLSPRQGYPSSQQNNQPTTWAQTQVANRLSLQQQQNPMLNAQLTGNYNSGNRGFQVQRQQQSQQQRTIGSPGAATTRQSPFPAEAFPPPASPTSGFANQNQFQQQMRLQRTISAPSATTQLPGGLGSPRPYAGRGDHPPPPGPMHHSQYPPPPPHPSQQQQQPTQHPPPIHHHQQHPMMYQQDSQYCYDQAGLQLAYNGADRGRGPPPPHLQGAGGAGNGMNATSEYVRQELRAVVGARTGQAPPSNVRAPAQLGGQQVSPSDLDALGISFEMSSTGASDSPKLWGAMGSDMGSMSPQPPPTLSSSSRTTSEEMARQGDQKSSLLQKLLSE